MDHASTEREVVGEYLRHHGKTLIDHGYNIISIAPGKKAPGFDGWEKTRSDQAQLKKWIENGRGTHGVGILTAHTPAVDIDVLDEDLAAILEAWCLEHLGAAPVRIGQAPKRLLLYRTDAPFRKVTSKTYLNEWEERCRIEVLGDGQQFVAYHRHPETHQPYRWVTRQTPLNTPAGDLTPITADQLADLVKLFEQEAEARGWTPVKSARRSAGKSGKVDYDDPFIADAQPVNLSQQELQQRLMLCPGAEEYETWLQVGMALYHQFDGEEIGREMWHEWSESADNYDADALNRKWDTFDIANKGRAPVTARLILQIAKDAAETLAIATAADLRDRFAQAKDRTEWNEVAKLARRAEIDHISRASLAEMARDRLAQITGSRVPLPEVKRTLAYEINTKDTPRWCRSWVYDVSDDRFFNTEAKYGVTMQGFNAMNDRHAMTKKDLLEAKTSPSSSAAHLALNVYKIPAVDGRRYAPGQDAVFMHGDQHWANTYPENQIPPKPKAIRPVDKSNIKRVRQHLEHLLADEKERQYLLDWISFVVQNPGKRVNHAILLQGVQGDGKSFFAFLLAAVMGTPNVRMANAHILETDFTGWAEGQCVVAIEEARMVGHNRHDTLNRLKPLVTNDVIEIHPKGRNPYNVVNTSSYFITTNYRDALPLSPNERRYLVLFSRWQSAEDLLAFKEDNPDYYTELYTALDESAPALRQWLLSLEQRPGFNARGDAPRTPAFWHMTNASQAPEIALLNEIIESGEHPDISEELVNVTLFQGLILNGDYDLELPQTKAIKKSLENAGYWQVGKVRLGEELCRFYSRTPDRFQINSRGKLSPDATAIRRAIEARRDLLEEM